MDKTNSYSNWDTIDAIDLPAFISFLTKTKQTKTQTVANILGENIPDSVDIPLDPEYKTTIEEIAMTIKDIQLKRGIRFELVDGFLLYATPLVINLLDIKIFLVTF